MLSKITTTKYRIMCAGAEKKWVKTIATSLTTVIRECSVISNGKLYLQVKVIPLK